MKRIRNIEVLETIEEVVDPRHTAILVIDVQNDEMSPEGSMAQHGHDIGYMRRILDPLRRVLDAARQRGVMIVYTRSTKSHDGRFETGPTLRFLSRKREVGVWDFKLEGTWGNEVADELAPRADERQLIKYHSSAFVGTPLDQLLRGGGIRTCVVVGTATEGCVEATVRSAQDHGYYPVVVGDCVTSRKTALHDAALTVIAGRWDCITSDELIDAWPRASGAG
jgi:nicotinamidase-related amidase